MSAVGQLLIGRKVRLRRLVPDDLEYLYRWENDPTVWRYGGDGERAEAAEPSGPEPNPDAERGYGGGGSGNGEVPYSREVLREFIVNQQYDIHAAGQKRFVICRLQGGCGSSDEHCIAGFCGVSDTVGLPISPTEEAETPVGFIDLYDFDPAALCAGVGILICDEADRRKGFASEAVELLEAYSKQVLGLRSLYCTIDSGNFSSIELFRGKEFAEISSPQKSTLLGNLQSDVVVLRKII